MKRVIALLSVIVIGLLLVPKTTTNVIESNIDTKYLKSDVIAKYVDVAMIDLEDSVTDEIEELENNRVEEKKQEEIVKKDNSSSNNSNNTVVKQEEVKEQPKQEEVSTNELLTGRMSGYGPDCKGCSGYLASGRYVGDGNIYYNDATYGNVRIVAGDSKYKFGTIVKIKDKNGEFLAIVLDRGGNIGIGKKFMFDLLFKTEAEASIYGTSNNTTFEILRNGY